MVVVYWVYRQESRSCICTDELGSALFGLSARGYFHDASVMQQQSEETYYHSKVSSPSRPGYLGSDMYIRCSNLLINA